MHIGRWLWRSCLVGYGHRLVRSRYKSRTADVVVMYCETFLDECKNTLPHCDEAVRHRDESQRRAAIEQQVDESVVQQHELLLGVRRKLNLKPKSSG